MLRRTALLALLWLAPAGAEDVAPERGRDPFAFRAVLDERPRMLVLALGRGLWVAYDAERAALYKVWPDGVDFQGAVYDWNHGPQPTSRGRSWWVSPWEEPWDVATGARAEAAGVRWRGHRFDGDRVTLLYDVALEGGGSIRVSESPELVRAADGSLGFARRFTTAGVPAGAELRLRMHLRRLRARAPLETNGRFERTPGAADGALEGRLALRANATTNFTAWLGEPQLDDAAAARAQAEASLPAGLAQLEASDCRVCHDAERRTVGPSFLEIARRYPDADAPRLARKVILGGSGAWGEAPMTAHPALAVADAEAMVAWILAQADPEPEVLTGWRRLPLWVLGPLVSAITWVQGDAGPHGIDVARLVPGVHPSFDLETIRPPGFEPRVGGLDVLPDGRVAVATWDADGAVYLVDGARVTRFAAGLLEPLGLTVVDGEIHVLQKHELTRLVDEDGDDVADRYDTVSDRWRCSANFHEFAFGLVHRDGHFYANLGTAVQPGGASAPAQVSGRGSVVRIAASDGAVEVIARGLRAPNGIGLGPGGRIFVTDNQGDWLPASKLLLVRPGAFFGSHAVGFAGTEELPVDPPVVWLPHSEIGNSPSQPVAIELGPWRGQLLHGDVHYGGLQRVFVEEVDGELQGAAFRFSQGLEAGVNRLAWGPDGKLYVGGIGGPGDWGQPGKLWYGLERLAYNGRPTFELLALRARAGGLEIELTEPLAPGAAAQPPDFRVRDWTYRPTADYGGPKIDERELPVRAVEVAPDRRRIFLALDALAPGRVVHLEVLGPLSGASGPLWSREAWYTLNRLPRASRRRRPSLSCGASRRSIRRMTPAR
jgi:cytochrome c